jgi:malonyl-CoA/methylmalonyl-CoA synthetase
VNTGVERTYAQLLADVLYLRNYVEARLSPSILKALNNGEEVYIGVLAAGGYEYVVAFLAVMALTAAIVPISELQDRFYYSYILLSYTELFEIGLC